MADFTYKATNREGKIVEGVVDAESQRAALAKLQEIGYIPLRIAEGSSESGGGVSIWKTKSFRSKRIRGKDLLMFTRELHTLLVAGLPLDRCLLILQELASNPAFHEVIRDVIRKIKGGKTLSDAMADHPKIFPRVYVNMVKAGEMGGVLPGVLHELCAYLERSEELRSYLISSLIYPCVIFFMLIVSLLTMILFVIPKFSQVFETSNAPIPLPMQILIAISTFFTQWWWALLGGLALTIFIFVRWKNSEMGRPVWDGKMLRFPVVGSLVSRVEIARFSRTLGTLIQSAVPLFNALSLVKDVIHNSVIAASIEPVKSGVKKGEGLVEPMRRTKIFPPLTLHLLQVGEETGNLSGMLVQAAEVFEEEIRVEIKRLINLLEPAMILFMGVVVGAIVISMVFSIFSISDIPSA